MVPGRQPYYLHIQSEWRLRPVPEGFERCGLRDVALPFHRRERPEQLVARRPLSDLLQPWAAYPLAAAGCQRTRGPHAGAAGRSEVLQRHWKILTEWALDRLQFQ